MSDLIDRRDAIDAAIEAADEWDGGMNPERAKIIGKAILNLPSAQPEREEFEWCHDCKEYDQNSHCCHRWTKVIRQTVEEMEAAQPERKWIPCSEMLPEEDTEVLISYRYKEGEGDTDHVNIDITSYGTVCFGGREIHTLKEWRQPFDYFHANYEVIAWMPLPAPYRKEGD